MADLGTFRARVIHESEGRPLVETLRAGLIGDGVRIDTPFGRPELLYADYVASGRALRQVEDFVVEEVLPYYANSHTEASFCGARMTSLREEARREIARLTGCGPDCHVVFAGSGATAGINRIVGLLDIRRRIAAGETVTVFVGPYEHHSNILPWRETGARIVEAPELGGTIDLAALDSALHEAESESNLVVGAFSAASNVTGIVTDTDAVTRILKRHGALAVWDYACGAPYLPMSMGAGDSAKDAIVYSSHKFPGGPGASGVMIVRDTLAGRATPTAPGGGTVSFVSPWNHAYAARIEAREEGGTPNVVGDIRAALVMLLKDMVGADTIAARDKAFRDRALAAWRDNPRLRLLGAVSDDALPIFSFQVLGPNGELVHHQLFTKMLSDIHGIQARGGCACAGPYGHRLLGLDRPASDALFARLRAGHELEKPGWVRLNFGYLMSDAQVDRIIEAVSELAIHAHEWTPHYIADPATARFSYRRSA